MTYPASIPDPSFRLFRWIVPFLATISLVVFVSPTEAALPSNSATFVIVTNSELAPAFEPLAAFKSEIGISTQVVTLEEIGAYVEPQVDLAATIRVFLQEARAQWGMQYVLLGGSLDVIPTRWVTSSYYPTIGSTDIPADLYYGGLDGDWDADGDGIFGEPYRGTDFPGDYADLEPDVGLGRAPVSTPADASLFVAKSIAYHTYSGSMALPRALLAADVLFPWDWVPGEDLTMDGATNAEELRRLLEGAEPPWLVDRYYENYTEYAGAINGTAASVLDAISTGEYRLVHSTAYATGDSLVAGQEYITGDQLAQLENLVPFFFVVTGNGGAAHDTRSPIVRAQLAQHGGCAAGLGATRAAFPTITHEYHTTFFEHALADPGMSMGDALRATFTDLVSGTFLDKSGRWTQLTMILLGDPTLPFSAVELPVSNDDHEISDNEDEEELPTLGLQARLTAAPNPFNPQVQIRSEVPMAGHVRVDVCDVRGRNVCVLFNGLHEAGEATWRWNGRDRFGGAVASGVYLIRMETEAQIVDCAVTLAR